MKTIVRSFALVALLFAFGCGSPAEGPRLYRVSGTVSFDGVPIEDGRILFRNLGSDGRAYSGSITKGAYEVECEAGTMSVSVTAMRPIPGKFDNSNGEKVQMTTQYIPAKYSSATTLKEEVKSGSNTINFDLKK